MATEAVVTICVGSSAFLVLVTESIEVVRLRIIFSTLFSISSSLACASIWMRLSREAIEPLISFLTQNQRTAQGLPRLLRSVACKVWNTE